MFYSSIFKKLLASLPDTYKMSMIMVIVVMKRSSFDLLCIVNRSSESVAFYFCVHSALKGSKGITLWDLHSLNLYVLVSYVEVFAN